MGFGVTNVRGIRKLPNYEAAKKHEESIVPIRGRANSVKPLSERNKDHMTIRKEGENIVIRLYQTDVVTYQPDGEIIINNGGWQSSTTNSFINALLPVFLSSYGGMTWFIAYADGWNADGWNTGYEGRKGLGWLPISNAMPMHLVAEEGKYYMRCLNPTFPVVHRMDRAKANSVRAKVGPFTKWLCTAIKLQEERWERGHKSAYWTPDGELSKLIDDMQSADHARWFEAGQVIMGSAEWNVASAKKVIDHTLWRLHGKEVFIPETVLSGKMVADPNRKKAL
jgi:hypothetical protein